MTETVYCVSTDNIGLTTQNPKQGFWGVGGGVPLVVKDQICKGIKFIPGGTNDVIWARLKKEYFNIEQGIYLGVGYISPMNSSYGQSIEYNPFDIICQDISNFMDKGRVILRDF